MKREIHWYSYPGGLQVSLVIKTREDEEWGPMEIIPVAFLPSPTTQPFGRWQDGSNELTNSEKLQIESRAKSFLEDWVEWSLNPNNEKNISKDWIKEQKDFIMSLLPEDYKIQK